MPPTRATTSKSIDTKEDESTTKTRRGRKTSKPGPSGSKSQNQSKSRSAKEVQPPRKKPQPDNESENVSKTEKRTSASRKAKHTKNSTAELSDSPFEGDEQQTRTEDATRSRDYATLSDGSDGWQSDREFLQQQVNILMTPFEITDCPELAKPGNIYNTI